MTWGQRTKAGPLPPSQRTAYLRRENIQCSNAERYRRYWCCTGRPSLSSIRRDHKIQTTISNTMGLFGSKTSTKTLATGIPVPSPSVSSDVSIVVVSPHVPSTPMCRSSRRPKANVVTPPPVTPSPARQHHSSPSKRQKQDVSPDVSLSSSGSVHPNKRQKLSSTSFGAVTHATFQKEREMEGIPAPAASAAVVPVHTLILGTHPGLQSLKKSQYYGHPMKYVYMSNMGEVLAGGV